MTNQRPGLTPVKSGDLPPNAQPVGLGHFVIKGPEVWRWRAGEFPYPLQALASDLLAKLYRIIGREAGPGLLTDYLGEIARLGDTVELRRNTAQMRLVPLRVDHTAQAGCLIDLFMTADHMRLLAEPLAHDLYVVILRQEGSHPGMWGAFAAQVVEMWQAGPRLTVVLAYGVLGREKGVS